MKFNIKEIRKNNFSISNIIFNKELLIRKNKFMTKMILPRHRSMIPFLNQSEPLDQITKTTKHNNYHVTDPQLTALSNQLEPLISQ